MLSRRNDTEEPLETVCVFYRSRADKERFRAAAAGRALRWPAVLGPYCRRLERNAVAFSALDADKNRLYGIRCTHSRLPTELQESFSGGAGTVNGNEQRTFRPAQYSVDAQEQFKKTGKILCDHAVRWEIGMPVLLAVVYGRQPGGFIIKPIQLKNSRRKGKETFFAQRPVPKLGPEALREPWPFRAPGTWHRVSPARRPAPQRFSGKRANSRRPPFPSGADRGGPFPVPAAAGRIPLRHPAQNARSRIHFDRAA